MKKIRPTAEALARRTSRETDCISEPSFRIQGLEISENFVIDSFFTVTILSQKAGKIVTALN
jgi:hypothetical protein